MPVRRLRRPALPSRRRVVSTAVTAVLVGGTFAGLLSVTAAPKAPAAAPVPSPSRTPAKEPAAERPATAPRKASVVQIVAHPDDDLFFMNPDISQSIRSGDPLTSVYLTSGESDGVNARPRDAATTAPDKAAYAEARQNGIRAAYAEMVTGSRTSPWDRVAIPTAGGAYAEMDTLRAKPQVKLVWLQLREAGSISGDRPESLNGLWHGRISALASQRAAGTPVAADFTYTADQVVATVAGILERFRPTFVRMQDPTPGTYEETGHLRDHQDHLYGARFAQAALARYTDVPGHPHVGVQNYLGYPTSVLPRTLDAGTADAKLKTLKTYAWLDGVDDCGTGSGCGDLKVAARPAGRGWAQTVRYARSTSTSWVQRDRDGGLHAFSVLDGRLATWRKAVGAASWRGPVLLPGGGLDSGVTSVLLPDGRIAVFGTRTTFGGGPSAYQREVVTVEQSAAGGAFGSWRSLGTPESDDARGTSDISAPAVTVGLDGRAILVLRDSGHRLAARERGADGGWGPWRTLGGADVYGDPVAATDAAGRGYVFASTPKTVLAWAARHPGGPLAGPVRTGLPTTTLALSASAAPGGEGIRLWFRKPASNDLRTADFSGAGLISPVRELAGGVAGFGPVSGAGGGPVDGSTGGTVGGSAGGSSGEPGAAAGASAGGEGMLAVRSRTGFLATAPLGPGGTRPTWRREGFLFSGAPDAGTAGVAAIGLDGRLHWTPADR